MTEQKTTQRRIYDADRAKEVLDNEAYQQAFADIKQEYFNAWINSPARDEEGRNALYLMVKTVEKVEATLVGMLADGKMARIQQEHESNLLAKQRAYGVSIG